MLQYDFDPSVDRTGGELHFVSGAGFVLVGSVPPDLRIVLNDRDPAGNGMQIQMAAGDKYVFPFNGLTVYHAGQPTNAKFSLYVLAPGEDYFPVPRAPRSTVFKTLGNASGYAGNALALWTPAAGKRIRLNTYDIGLTTANPTNVGLYKSAAGTAGSAIANQYLAAAGSSVTRSPSGGILLPVDTSIYLIAVSNVAVFNVNLDGNEE